MEEKTTYTAPYICTIKVERSPSLTEASPSGKLNVKTETDGEFTGGGDGDASTGL